MAKRKKATDDLHSPSPAWTAETSTELLDDRPGYDDGTTLAEPDDLDDVEDLDDFADEPIVLVDAPVRLREPMTKADKRRNQRR